jgi:RteC protein
MKDHWLKLYESMMAEISSCCLNDGDTKTSIECCFNIGQKYWAQIQNGMEELHFDSPNEEIRFYKHVKPLFKSEIEYFNLLYQSELFRPKEKHWESKEYWIREQQKLDKFIQDNIEFYNYHKSGATEKDEEYFLSTGTVDEYGKNIYPDDLIASLLALEKYAQYVQSEISLLKFP